MLNSIAQSVRLALSSILVAVAGTAEVRASVVTFDFEDSAGFGVYSNYYSSGFRFSPNCHLDSPLGPTGIWLGWDRSGCSSPTPGAPPGSVESNPDWLGPSTLTYGNGGAWMYIDFSGRDFSFLSTDVVPGEEMRFVSSKGGDWTTPYTGGVTTNFAFTGSEWRNIEWILISGGPGFPIGIDNMRVQVAEPPTLALLAAALFSLLAARSRKRQN
jgi:hypothetical protein